MAESLAPRHRPPTAPRRPERGRCKASLDISPLSWFYHRTLWHIRTRQSHIRPGGDGMAETNQKVMAMVEAELKKNAKATNEALFEKAQKIDKAVGKLTIRQFHARYPLQVKRRKAIKAGGGRRKASGAGTRRGRKAASSNAVRDVLTQLVRETAGKDGAALVDIVAGLDVYVEKVMKAAGR